MKTIKQYKLFFAVMMMSLLTACGFHLRGDVPLPPQLKVMYLQSNNPYDPFTIAIKNLLISHQIKIVASQSDAPVTLQILSVNFNQALTNISPNTQVRTYSLTYTMSFQLKSPDNTVILPPAVITTTLPFSTSDAQLLADSQVLVQQQQQMQADLVVQLFNRLNSQQSRTVLAKVNAT